MGRNNEDFQGSASEHEYALEYTPAGKYLGHTITATHNGSEVGSYEWGTPGERNTPNVGKIASVYVYPHHRRKGLATRMHNAAKQIAARNPEVPMPKHSDDRSPEGDAWANSTKDRIPKTNNYGKI